MEGRSDGEKLDRIHLKCSAVSSARSFLVFHDVEYEEGQRLEQLAEKCRSAIRAHGAPNPNVERNERIAQKDYFEPIIDAHTD